MLLNGEREEGSFNKETRMDLFSKRIPALSIMIFSSGVVLSLIFIVISVWGDLEASLFDASIREETSIKAYRCPIMITNEEIGIVKASLSNPLDREIERFIQTNISEGHVTLMRQIRTHLPLAPGETRDLEYEVYPEDAAFGRFIFARTHVFRNAPLPSQSSACGILVVNIPFVTGNQLIAFLVAGGVVGLVSGWGLWYTSNRPLKGKKAHTTYSMLLLLILLLFGIVFGFVSQWMLGLAALIGAIFLIVELIAYSSQ
jgi:hypothetical protein